ncbi:unnamed protein product [Closterium sp. NIES-54]
MRAFSDAPSFLAYMAANSFTLKAHPSTALANATFPLSGEKTSSSSSSSSPSPSPTPLPCPSPAPPPLASPSASAGWPADVAPAGRERESTWDMYFSERNAWMMLLTSVIMPCQEGGGGRGWGVGVKVGGRGDVGLTSQD